MEFVLKGIFDYAVSNGWIGENPVDRVTVPKIASDDDDMVFLWSARSSCSRTRRRRSGSRWTVCWSDGSVYVQWF